MAQGDRAGRGCLSGRGFTLVELLVVVSIICLMMSLLLPTLTRAQRQGEQIHCLANQHQLLLGWLLYAPDHDDKLCKPESYRSQLLPYVLEEEVFACKALGNAGRRGSYAVSNTMGGDLRDGVEPFVLLHQVSYPVQRMVFIDRELGSSTCFWPLLRDEETWLWRPAGGFYGLQGMTARHNDGCNIYFADGHGEYVRWKDDRTLKLIKGLIADSEEASTENQDLQYMVRVLTRP
jgi:prepilin-type N-terminal cleavage/methylation domain-containing protein/prepilin-type processing-associated H-X9-DG protein